MSRKEESLILSRKMKNYVVILKINAVGGIAFAKESPEFETEEYHYSSLNLLYWSY